jgi:uncharacterized membrane protein
MEILSEVYYFIGSLVCHQISERTIYLDNLPLPVCARDTGIHMGFFIAFVFCFVKGRLKSDKPPDLSISIVLVLMMIPMMIDGTSSYIGLRHTDNTIRLLTGLFFGMPIPIFLVPAANFKVFETNSNTVIKHWGELLILGIVSLLAAIMTMYQMFSWLFISSIFIFSLIFIIIRVVYTILKVLKGNKR